MDVSPESKLNQQLKSGYESFAGSSQVADGSSTSDSTCDLNGNTDLSRLPKEIPLKQMTSGSPNLLDRSLPPLKETDEGQDTLTSVYAALITFAAGVTIALFLHIYLVEGPVFVKGVLVSDHESCTALGQRVLHDRGSSVDAAIAAALCLGVMHPHVSGVGGSGVMLVHDIHKNQTRVINFQGTAPETLTEEMLQNVSQLKAGLQVGVPGVLRGLNRAHSLYGRLPWEDVVSRAAAVAKEGFNVSVSLAEAVSKVKGEQLSQRFRDVFLPDGQALSPGLFLRMPGLAGVLEAGLSNFYDGNFSQEMEDEVRASGGVLSRGDIRNYSAQVERPVEGLYDEFIIQVPPQPSAGAALISALNLLQDVHLNENSDTENQTHHWITEALRAVLAAAGGSFDPQHNSSVTERLSDMLSKSQAEALRQRTNSSHTSPPEHSSTVRSLQTELTVGQVVVMGPDDLVVSVASSLSRPFGSRIMTRSGVILNSLILDFTWPNKTRGRLLTNQKNRVQPGKRPLLSLMPTIVVPAGSKCGTYVALSSSAGRQSLSVITQVLISVLSLHKENNGSLHPQLQPHRPLVEHDRVLFERSHTFQRVKTHSVVHVILRKGDAITAKLLVSVTWSNHL
ncbi:glutathione hydrolase 7-like [Pempheris klunzingeri]|uniref:glutathione hydrolase 7-like n=1 Tax=Pempheris klunzingeri TaxID=3127111 RepID=UPI003981148E